LYWRKVCMWFHAISSLLTRLLSCCSKNNICGYGPDNCGDGCQSQCDATAMCGEYSEDADMPCGMKLCCEYWLKIMLAKWIILTRYQVARQGGVVVSDISFDNLGKFTYFE
jgi:hypothetical protein